MIAFGFDLQRMQSEMKAIIETVPPMMPSPSFGGWSLLSRDGTLEDGWHQGHLAMAEKEKGFRYDPLTGQQLGMSKWISDYDKRTRLCDGYFGKILDVLEARGFNPRRARISLINPGHETSLHVDGPSDTYAARLHIPISTNPDCAFEYEDESYHMPADGNGVVVRVHRLHRAFNRGATARYHLLMDIFDFQGATRFNRFDPSTERLPTWRSED